MAWNYRVMRHQGQAANDEPFYAVHEVHYATDGAVSGWTAESVGCSGETMEEMSRDIAWYLTALVKPVLDYSTGIETEAAHLMTDDIFAMVGKLPPVSGPRPRPNRRVFARQSPRTPSMTVEATQADRDAAQDVVERVAINGEPTWSTHARMRIATLRP